MQHIPGLSCAYLSAQPPYGRSTYCRKKRRETDKDKPTSALASTLANTTSSASPPENVSTTSSNVRENDLHVEHPAKYVMRGEKLDVKTAKDSNCAIWQQQKTTRRRRVSKHNRVYPTKQAWWHHVQHTTMLLTWNAEVEENGALFKAHGEEVFRTDISYFGPISLPCK